MKRFRIRCVSNAFILFPGVIFLNLSFLFAEVSALKLDPNNRMALNFSILPANSMAEEEPGADEDSTISTLDFIVNHHPTVGGIDLFSNNNFSIWSHGHTKLAEFEIIKPPPQA